MELKTWTWCCLHRGLGQSLEIDVLPEALVAKAAPSDIRSPSGDVPGSLLHADRAGHPRKIHETRRRRL